MFGWESGHGGIEVCSEPLFKVAHTIWGDVCGRELAHAPMHSIARVVLSLSLRVGEAGRHSEVNNITVDLQLAICDSL